MGGRNVAGRRPLGASFCPEHLFRHARASGRRARLFQRNIVMNYWEMLQKIIKEKGITIDRKEGTQHPRYPDIIYVVDYGYINNTKSMDMNEIDVFVGKGKGQTINGVFCSIDISKNDSEIKVVIDCTDEEVKAISNQLNNSKYMKAIYMPNGNIE
jgi:inorganic pyrophosphatase